MRFKVPVLLMTLILTMPGGMAAPSRHHAMVELELGSEIVELLQARGQGKDAVQIQTVALNLKGVIYFHEQGSLILAPGQGQAKPLKMKLLLERGDYLLEFLLFDARDDRFEFKVLPVSITKKSPAEITFKLPVDSLSQSDFKNGRKRLILNPKRLYQAFDDHMLWYRVRELSRRNPERWPDVFREVKLQSLQMQSSPFVQNLAGKSPLPDSSPLPWIVAEKIFEIAILADNIDFMSARLAGEPAPAAAEWRRLLAQLEKDARRIRSIASSMEMTDLFSARVDKEQLRNAVARLEPKGVAELLRELSGELGQAVRNCFFSGKKTIEVGRLGLSNPLLASRKIELVGAEAKRAAATE